jgi:hypothetical protein
MIHKIAPKKWVSRNTWFFFSCDGELYRWMLKLGSFEVSWEAP